MPDAFHEMSNKGLGMTTVLHPDGRLAGIITDGDLRRLMERRGGQTLEMNAGACMTTNAQTIGPHVERPVRSSSPRSPLVRCEPAPTSRRWSKRTSPARLW